MAYYAYPVYVLGSLIVLILSIILIIYTIHFYKFVKSRIVFIKLEPEENNLNNWTFDLYPFTSSRIWKIFGYAIVCLPSTFQQASAILVCQCKVVKFKTVLPKSACDVTKGIVTPSLKRKETMDTKEKGFDEKSRILKPLLKDILPPTLVVEAHEECEEIDDELEEDLEQKEDSKISLDLKKEDEKRESTPTTESEITTKSNCSTPTKQINDENIEKKLSRFPGKLIRNLKRESKCNGSSCNLNSNTGSNNSIKVQNPLPVRPQSTIITLEPDNLEHNISIMSIDNLCESEYFIIPEARPIQTLVVFNEPFNSSCPICLDEFEIEEEIALLACHHGYHKDCLNKALRQNASCPYCKSESNVRTFRVSEEIPLLWQTMSRRNSSAVNV